MGDVWVDGLRQSMRIGSLRPAWRTSVLLLALAVTFPRPLPAQTTTTAGELGLEEMPCDTAILVLPPNDRGGDRLGCGDVGYTTYPYAVSDPPTTSYVWLAADTMYGDDLTLESGTWRIGCYDVFIYADNDPAYGCNQVRTVTLRAHESCNGSVIPGSQESWQVPPHGGPVLLTGESAIDFVASGTIWFSLTTTIHGCDGWYAGNANLAGSTSGYVQAGDDCYEFIEGAYNKFHVVLYGSPCVPPVLTAHPDDAVVCDGTPHEFCVEVEGTETVDYRWQFDGGTGFADIPEADEACHTAVTPGEYRCVVTGDCGTVTSQAATLQMLLGPGLTTQPQGGILCPGDAHELCVTASGTGELHYLWKRNGLPLIGAAASCYSATLPGSYHCVVTDDCGSIASDAAEVTSPGEIEPAAFVEVLLGADPLPEHLAASDMDCDGDADGQDIPLYVDHLLGR